VQIKGQVEGVSPAQLELQKAKEHQAGEALRALDAKFKIPKTDLEAYEMALQIENDFPGTSAAVSAVAAKGKALIKLHRCDEAYEVYARLLARASTEAPGSPLVDTALRGCSHAILKRGQYLLDRAAKADKNLPQDALDKVRADLNRVIAMKADKKHIARAHLLLAEVEFVSGRLNEAEAMLDKLIVVDYATPEKSQIVFEQILSFHDLLSEVARRLGKFDKAMQTCERIKTLCSELPEDKQSRLVKQALDNACGQRYIILISQHADLAQVEAAGQEVLARIPGSRYADIVRKRSRTPASNPSP
jgi:tetratricopeptide (TPR) repeat protein